MKSFNFNQTDNFDELQKAIEQYRDVAEKSIGEVLQGEGAEEIIAGIKVRIHPSRRKWKKKKKASSIAKSLKVDKKKSTELSVVINTTADYGYLYYPDDGTNTKHHVGNQQFMLKGAEDKSQTVLQMCIDNIFENANVKEI